MPRYRAGATKAGVNTANTAYYNLWAAGTRRLMVRRISIFVATAPTTAPVFALKRSTARGTQTTTATPLQNDPDDAAATAAFDSVWSVAPTFTNTAPFNGIIALPVTAGAGFVWDFTADSPLEIASGAGLVLFNTLATGATLGLFASEWEYDE